MVDSVVDTATSTAFRSESHLLAQSTLVTYSMSFYGSNPPTLSDLIAALNGTALTTVFKNLLLQIPGIDAALVEALSIGPAAIILVNLAPTASPNSNTSSENKGLSQLDLGLIIGFSIFGGILCCVAGYFIFAGRSKRAKPVGDVNQSGAANEPRGANFAGLGDAPVQKESANSVPKRATSYEYE